MATSMHLRQINQRKIFHAMLRLEQREKSSRDAKVLSHDHAQR
jgi:hypothetical protein